MSRNVHALVSMLILTVVTAGSFAASTVINVDLNSGASPTYSGLAAAPDAPTNTTWNGSNTGAGTGLLESDGTVTSVAFALTAHSDVSGFTTTLANALFNDFVYDPTNDNTTSTTFTITGLNPALRYNLYLYSMTGYNGSPNNTLFTVDGITTLVTGFPESPDNLDSTFIPATTGVSTGENKGNYVLYTQLAAVGGTVTGSFQGTNERFNGFQIAEAPEPASLGLLLAGGVMLLRRRRPDKKLVPKERIMSRNTGMFVLVAVFSLFTTGLVNAASTVINVDFNSSEADPNPKSGTYVGLGAGPDVAPDTFWNGVTVGAGGVHAGSFTSGGLIASDSTTATGVTFTLDNYSSLDGKGQYSSVGGYTTTFAEDLFGDLVYNQTFAAGPSPPANTGIATFSIDNLVPGVAYNLYLYSMMGYPNSDNTTFTVAGVAGSTTVTGLPATYGSAFAPVTAGTTGGGNYVLYSHVIAVGGTISGTFAGGNPRFNGFQIAEAPEPASLGLLLTGGLMLLRRRRA